jgi:hypothetical protein
MIDNVEQEIKKLLISTKYIYNHKEKYLLIDTNYKKVYSFRNKVWYWKELYGIPTAPPTLYACKICYLVNEHNDCCDIIKKIHNLLLI